MSTINNNKTTKPKSRKFFIISVAILTILLIGGGIYGAVHLFVKSNHDIRLVTDNSSCFFIFCSGDNEYYFVNSSLGIKVKTREFNTNSGELNDAQLQQLKEIERLDNKFTINKFGQTSYYVFFYENYIFYTRYKGESGPQISDKDWQDMQNNIYKYNIDTQEIEQIIAQRYFREIGASVNVKVEALMYVYPHLSQAVLSKIGSYNFGDAYYSNGRVFFTTYYSSTKKGTDEILYEYLVSEDKVRKVIRANSSIVEVEAIR
jgi:hypothetical protein